MTNQELLNAARGGGIFCFFMLAGTAFKAEIQPRTLAEAPLNAGVDGFRFELSRCYGIWRGMAQVLLCGTGAAAC